MKATTQDENVTKALKDTILFKRIPDSIQEEPGKLELEIEDSKKSNFVYFLVSHQLKMTETW